MQRRAILSGRGFCSGRIGRTASGIARNALVSAVSVLGPPLALIVANRFLVSAMTALNLVQALIPTTPGSKSGTGQGSGTDTSNTGSTAFSLLLPGNAESAADATTGDPGANAANNGETTSAEDPSTSLVDILSGAQATNIASDEQVGLDGLAVTPEGSITGVNDDGIVELTETELEGTAAPGTQSDTAQAGAVASAANGTTVPTQAPSGGEVASTNPASTLPADPTSQIKAAAPQTQTTQPVTAPETSAAPALQAKGDLLEGGKGAPTAQQLLGTADPKAASDTAQRDPTASTLLNGNAQKNAFGANAANGSQQSFAANSGTQNGNQPAFHEVSSQQLQQENPAQRLLQQTAAPPPPRFDVAPQTAATPDIGTATAGQTDGTLLADQRPPVTVTVRFDQTIQGQQLAAQQLAFHMKRNFANGVNRFEVRLDPPELGRIDVRLDLGADGRVAAALTVDRPETLDLLQRDARLLQKALEEAGVNVDDGALNFSLRDGNEQAAEEDGNGSGLGGTSAQGDGAEDDLAGSVAQQQVAIVEDDRVDIRV